MDINLSPGATARPNEQPRKDNPLVVIPKTTQRDSEGSGAHDEYLTPGLPKSFTQRDREGLGDSW
jgi:hypothetical protein